MQYEHYNGFISFSILYIKFNDILTFLFFDYIYAFPITCTLLSKNHYYENYNYTVKEVLHVCSSSYSVVELFKSFLTSTGIIIKFQMDSKIIRCRN